ncbi:hypothetical protein [Streptomyces sp. SudanB182_2057]|uniref:hypothetical protein n=1 Tax=Streptomyces sp. SudanB182_2057 TaxID=3035281 RepID=UPI003F55E9E8
MYEAERINAEGGGIAVYKGREINLAEGWQGAAVCGENPVTGQAKCWDSVEESSTDPYRRRSA